MYARPWLACPTLFCATCYAGPPGASEGSSAAATSAATTSATATTTTTTTTTTTATTTETSTTTTGMDLPMSDSVDLPRPPAPAIHYVGRFDASDPTQVRMGWSGVGLVARFYGTGARVTLDDKARFFTLVLDGQLQPRLATTPGIQTYTLAADLPAGEHTLELYRRTEGSFGPSVVLGLEIEGELLAPPPVERRIEVIGDSITCGYGNEGTSPCNFSADTENHYLTYGAIAARALGAEIHTIAWSGKGLVYNFGDDTFEPLPQVYERLLATSDAPWDFSWQPDVVVINLGTNDFSTGGDPPEALFVPAYVEFLAHLRSLYPAAFILALAPSLWGQDANTAEAYIQSAVDQRHAAGDLALDFANINIPWLGSGCDGHPDLATHAAMGANLRDEIATRLAW